MTFEDILDQALATLQRRGRVTYRTLKLQFQLDEEQLEALKEELIEGQRVALDEGGKVLVWTGTAADQAMGTPRSLVSEPRRTSSEADTGTEKPRVSRPPEGERRQLTVA